MKWSTLRVILCFAILTDILVITISLIVLFNSQGRDLEGTILTFSIEAITLTFSNFISLLAGIYIGANKEKKDRLKNDNR